MWEYSFLQEKIEREESKIWENKPVSAPFTELLYFFAEIVA